MTTKDNMLDYIVARFPSQLTTSRLIFTAAELSIGGPSSIYPKPASV
jgi:hypothetical protein